MAEYIDMPKLGFDMREAVLLKWLKNVGEEVKKGDIIAEIESDKATLELESQASGVMLQQLQGEGAVVPVGGHMAVVGAQGEDVSALGGPTPAPAKSEPAVPGPADRLQPLEEARGDDADKGIERQAEPAKAAEPAPQPEAAGDDSLPGGARATPLARRIAREHGVDLRQINGKGPDGRVRRADVEAYLAGAAQAPAATPQPTAAPTPVSAAPGATEVATSRLRQAIGRRMVESKTTVPHFYVTSSVDMEKALALRKEINALLPEEQKVSVNDMVVKAAGLALRDFPNLNASLSGDKLIRHGAINVGSAVAVEGGLLTVIQRGTDKAPLLQVASENKAMIARVRSGKISPNDVTEGTFTVSNLGGYDVDEFIAIINPPEAAILAIGSALPTPVVRDGQVVAGVQMKVTISADHRITDGAEAARYLQKLKEILEAPLRLLL
jgi:pyruvate dehydrogenase E2 component (dihydrolipoamide acetyltransferase)